MYQYAHPQAQVVSKITFSVMAHSTFVQYNYGFDILHNNQSHNYSFVQYNYGFDYCVVYGFAIRIIIVYQLYYYDC